MIDVKTAAHRALDFVRDLYEGEQLKHLALEEIRLSDDERWWLVTVGFQSLHGFQQLGNRQGSQLPLSLPAAELVRLPRDLKLVKINADTGEPAPQLSDLDLSKAG
jgi:hypothetical protein